MLEGCIGFSNNSLANSPRAASPTRLGPTTFYYGSLLSICFLALCVRLCYILPFSFVFFYFVNAEERNRKAHAENGNMPVSFPAAPVQPPAPSIPQMRRLALLLRAPFCFLFLFSRGWRRSSSIIPSSKSFAGSLPPPPKPPTGTSCSSGFLPSSWPPSWGRMSLLHACTRYYINYMSSCRMLWCDRIQSMVKWIALLIFADRRDPGNCTSKASKVYLRLLLQQVVRRGPLLAHAVCRFTRYCCNLISFRTMGANISG